MCLFLAVFVTLLLLMLSSPSSHIFKHSFLFFAIPLSDESKEIAEEISKMKKCIFFKPKYISHSTLFPFPPFFPIINIVFSYYILI